MDNGAPMLEVSASLELFYIFMLCLAEILGKKGQGTLYG